MRRKRYEGGGMKDEEKEVWRRRHDGGGMKEEEDVWRIRLRRY